MFKGGSIHARPLLLAALATSAMAISGCGGVGNQASPKYFGPAAISVGPTAPTREVKYVFTAPGEAKPASRKVVRAGAGLKERFWLAPWKSPDGGRDFFCLYTQYRSGAGPTTNCFGPDEFRSGRAYWYSPRRSGIDVLGFLPDGWSVAPSQSRSSDAIRQKDGVYWGHLKGSAAALTIRSPDGPHTRVHLGGA